MVAWDILEYLEEPALNLHQNMTGFMNPFIIFQAPLHFFFF